MKIKSITAHWVRVPIPEAQQHVSDFGRVSSFDATIVRIETACGLVGYGEAKEEVGSSGNNHGLTAIIRHKFAPMLIGVSRAIQISPDAAIENSPPGSRLGLVRTDETSL